MKVKNLLHQPLELDFDKQVIRFNAKETKDVPDKYANHKVFKRNENVLQVLVKPKAVKEKGTSDVQPEK